MLSIAVWGGGSLGLLWAARLARIFPETVLLVRTEEQRDWIREKGIRLTDLAGKEERIPVHVRWIGEVGDEAFDCLLIMVKQRHLPGVAEALAAFSRLPALAVLWQNGLGQEEAFESLFPPGVLCGAVTTEGAYREGPGEVRHTGGGQTWIGPFASGAVRSEVAARFLAPLRDEGVRIEWESPIVRRIWEKVMVNCAINPLTALLRIRNGELLRSDEALSLMESVVEEAVSVARAEGVGLEADAVLKRVVEVCRRTAENRSSMLQDVERGQRTEIDWINGEVVRRGTRAGIETPVNRTLVRLIRLLEVRCSPDSGPTDGRFPSR